MLLKSDEKYCHQRATEELDMAAAETDPAKVDNRRKLAVQLIIFARFKAGGYPTEKPRRLLGRIPSKVTKPMG